MEEFIKMATSKLGASESSVRSATSGVLQMIQGKAGAADFSELTTKLPGASELLGQASVSSGKGGGMLGGLMKNASSMAGGKLGATMGLIGMFKGSGLDMKQATAFGPMLLAFVKDKVGGDLVGRILAKVPELQKLAG